MKKMILATVLTCAVFAGMLVSQVETETGVQTPVHEAEAATSLGSFNLNTSFTPECYYCGTTMCKTTTSAYKECEWKCKTGEGCVCSVGPTECDDPGPSFSWSVYVAW